MRNSTDTRSPRGQRRSPARAPHCLDLRHTTQTQPDRRSPERDAPCACAEQLLGTETFIERLGRAVADARDGGAHALYVVHVEHFEGAEARGKDANIVLLRRLAPFLSARLGMDICAGQLGGGRFSLLRSPCVAHETPLFARRIRTALERDPFAWQGLAFRLGVSVGGTPLTGNIGVRELMNCAIHACDAARELGGDGVVVLCGERAERQALHQELDWHEHLSEVLG